MGPQTQVLPPVHHVCARMADVYTGTQGVMRTAAATSETATEHEEGEGSETLHAHDSSNALVVTYAEDFMSNSERALGFCGTTAQDDLLDF